MGLSNSGVATPWLISLAVIAVLWWVFGRKGQ
jgi:hypothetical protein